MEPFRSVTGAKRHHQRGRKYVATHSTSCRLRHVSAFGPDWPITGEIVDTVSAKTIPNIGAIIVRLSISKDPGRKFFKAAVEPVETDLRSGVNFSLPDPSRKSRR